MSAFPPAPLAVSLGDPAGIGPELIVEAWSARLEQNLQPFAVVGGAMVLSAAAQRRGIECPIVNIREPGEAVDAFGRGLPVMGSMDGEYAPGTPDADGARLALSSLTQATELARQGIAGGVVTAPIAKSELAKVGFTFPGQTEFLADACGFAPDDAVMML
ncbi:MAG: 4-hydroxythreonine-4-phosphate dehydrogenase, partial [Sphingomonadales bacterium]